jgi:hypothetical protein
MTWYARLGLRRGKPCPPRFLVDQHTCAPVSEEDRARSFRGLAQMPEGLCEATCAQKNSALRLGRTPETMALRSLNLV